MVEGNGVLNYASFQHFLEVDDVARAFGFTDANEYLDALEREGPRIVKRMQWGSYDRRRRRGLRRGS